MRRNRRILTLQQRAREVGRIRLGEQVETAKGGTRPARLETFRFTSPSEAAINAIADLYGGDPRPWGDGQHEVITKAKEIEVAVPTGFDPVSQSYEMWSAGGCTRRCDGQTEYISGGACMCDAELLEQGDASVCKPTLRVSLLLPDVPLVGVWRLETHGYYANTELPAMIAMLQAVPRHVRGTLRLEKRSVKRDGKTRTFPVPVLDVHVSMAAIVDGDQSDNVRQLPKPTRPVLPPGPDPEALPPRGGGEPDAPTPPPVDIDETVDVEPDEPAQVEPALASDAQRRKMNNAAKELGIPRDVYVEMLSIAREDGKGTTLGITVDECRAVVEAVSAWAAEAQRSADGEPSSQDDAEAELASMRAAEVERGDAA